MTEAKELIEILREDPWRSPPPFEKLVGDLVGAFSRRINIQHRLVYQVEVCVPRIALDVRIGCRSRRSSSGAQYVPCPRNSYPANNFNSSTRPRPTVTLTRRTALTSFLLLPLPDPFLRQLQQDRDLVEHARDTLRSQTEDEEQLDALSSLREA